MKVVHLTSVHQRNDTRIFLKECCSLQSIHNVNLVVADGLGNNIINGIRIYDVGKSTGRLSRMTKTTHSVFLKAKELDADIYHLHDPELIPCGLKLKKLGKVVVFDSHEDLIKQLLSKPYLNIFVRQILSFIFTYYIRITCKKFDGIVTATPAIKLEYQSINANCIDVNNYPLLGELSVNNKITQEIRKDVCYVGGITEVRGIRELIVAMSKVKTNTYIHLVGNFSSLALEQDVCKLEGWDKVYNHGFLDRKGIKDILGNSLIGIVTFLPAPNHIDSQPNKMFEYMSAGVAVIASDFPLWKNIIEGNNCGICVNPLDVDAIANAIDSLVSDPELARKMGRNGLMTVEKIYNWSVEEKKLFEFYDKLMKRK